MHDEQRIIHSLKKLTISQLKTRLNYNLFVERPPADINQHKELVELYYIDLERIHEKLEKAELEFAQVPSFFERVAVDRARKELDMCLGYLRDLTELAVIKKMLGDVGFKSVSLD